MAKKKPLSQFEREFIHRTKAAREGTGYSQDRMARLLGIDQGTYKNYEVKRTLPHRYVPQFCAICHVELDWLYGLAEVRQRPPPFDRGSAAGRTSA